MEGKLNCGIYPTEDSNNLRSNILKKPNTIILGIFITVIRTMTKSHLVWKDFILTYNCSPAWMEFEAGT